VKLLGLLAVLAVLYGSQTPDVVGTWARTRYGRPVDSLVWVFRTNGTYTYRVVDMAYGPQGLHVAGVDRTTGRWNVRPPAGADEGNESVLCIVADVTKRSFCSHYHVRTLTWEDECDTRLATCLDRKREFPEFKAGNTMFRWGEIIYFRQ